MKKFLLSFFALTCLLTNKKAIAQSSCALNPDFSDPAPTKIVDGGALGGGYEVGDSYLFENVLPSINAEVDIEAIAHAQIFDLDNNSINSNRFRPVIMSNSTNNEGYVQFVITFRRSSDNTIIPLNSLKLTDYDVDGETSPTYIIHETGWVTEASVSFNSPSNLTDAGIVVDGFSWRKILSQAAVSVPNDPANSFTAVYNPASVFRFRLGYSHDQFLSAGHSYSVEFGCFIEAQNVPLPLTLLNFSGSYNNNKSVLNWTTQSEVNVDRYELERSYDGINFAKVGSVNAKGLNGATSDYQFIEDMVNTGGSLFYYRLKSVDKDGRFTYSKVVALRRDNKMFNEISVLPNPVINGNGVIKINTTATGSADLKIVDFSGRIVVLQKIKLFEGINVLPITNIRQLPAGMYSLQLFKGGEVLNSKFVIGR